MMISGRSAMTLPSPLPGGERSDCIVRCNPGEGLPRVQNAPRVPSPAAHLAMRVDLSPSGRGKRRRRRNAQAGFTLVEILVVITIIGLIMALVGPRVLGYLGESKAKAAKIQIESFSSALDLYYLDLGRYPTSAEGLTALTRSTNAPGWNGPYLRGGVVTNDPWGHGYLYRSPGERAPYEIISLGSDGQEGGSGTAADIASGTR